MPRDAFSAPQPLTNQTGQRHQHPRHFSHHLTHAGIYGDPRNLALTLCASY
ncbi:hypothetical protein [Pseudomonas sp. H9]|uniref:hypothetical protein n=1 Tax=Pseudomonas sp. H9 TaxID=483968 RepID=UPI001404BC6A|nr:hypothetical protein [Pseudomonas sp. H9]